MTRSTRIHLTILLIAIAVALLTGCGYTKKAAEKDLNQLQQNYPERLAEYAREKNPCIEGPVTPSNASELKKYQDSIDRLNAEFDSLQALEPTPIIDSFLETWADTTQIRLLRTKANYLQHQLELRDLRIQALNFRIQSRPILRDTLKILDKADLTICNQEKKKLEATNKKLRRWLLPGWIVSAVLFLLLFLLHRKRKNEK